MPPRRSPEPAQPQASSSTAVALASMPEDVRRDLLRAQAENIQTPQSLVQMKILPAGAGQFELSDTPGETFPRFKGVVLHAHPSNVLWDRKFGAELPQGDDLAKLPACSSNDGIRGVPREGFAHAGLNGARGDGVRTVECRTCPYNAWGSGAMLIPDKNPRGKAVTNNRRVYILLEGRDAPVELVLPPTSLAAFDEYSASLLNQGIPLLAVVTEFSQSRTGQGRITYAVVNVRNDGYLTAEQFAVVRDARQRYLTSIMPQAPITSAQAQQATAENNDNIPDGELEDEDDDLPF